jgi:ribonuclease HI
LPRRIEDRRVLPGGRRSAQYNDPVNETNSDSSGPLSRVFIYTDGACTGNPGPGGYGALLVHGETRKEISGGFARTTNNRMEILAAIAALETLARRCRVTVCSDSQYVVNAISKGWAKKWQANGWMRNPKEAAINPDLWERLLALCARHEIDFVWVRGHAGHPENERCDILSTTAARQKDLPPDPGYR